MSDNFTKDTKTFESSNSSDNIAYYVWTPMGAPRAVVQIVHGMCEHMGRYEEFARFLASKGFVVCGHDQLGHGNTAKCDEDLGFFAESDGDRFLLEDVEKLRGIMRGRYRRLPYFLLGHSFGSFVARAYAAAYPEGNIDGLIISGTCGDNLPAKAGEIAANMIASIKGKRYRSPMLYKLAFGSYNKRFKSEIKESNGNAWVTTDKEELARYNSDKFCTFRFTAQAYHDMFMLINYNKTHLPPRSTPVLIFSGVEDPVGNYGLGVSALYEKYFESAISDVTLKLYENERHEVLTGVKRHEAFEDVSAWMDRVIDAKIELMKQNTFNF